MGAGSRESTSPGVAGVGHRQKAQARTAAKIRNTRPGIVSRLNARKAKRIDIERAELWDLPERRSTDYENISVRITSSGGSPLAQGVLQRALASHRSRT